MRADRLVATLLFLQARGRVTVAEVAAELEVSERTARRDLEALASAGIPVYSQRGRGGGWSLVGGARTDLTGLTAGEIRALFLVAGPSSATPELRTALRKLVRALPATLRSGAEAASRAGVTDDTDWSRSAVGAAAPHLDALRRAVVDGTQIRLGYAAPGRPNGERTVHPLGIASKAGVDYLVAGTDRGLRAYRLSRVTSVEATGDPVVRPDGFDLTTAWRSLAGRMEDRMLAATVRGRAERSAEPVLQGLFGGRLTVGRPLGGGWVEITVDGPSPEILAAQLAGLGARVEILEPAAARKRLARLAAELAATYGSPTTGGAVAEPRDAADRPDR
ncbi:WYL domain-containing protein [Streptomyces sp. NBC_00322]|uniref:helix-turn-helix transcriptional regulator n=1 Tax=Streptomyces sp. NBC_00322 TaxID=2975712 RepID=UPI002E2839E7|nr:WYL domain-containing protein [Streptomyces sp. NBC_00322]